MSRLVVIRENQIRAPDWPSGAGEAIAVLDVSRSELEDMLSLRFVAAQGDLGEAQQLSLLIDGLPIVLFDEIENEQGGIEVIADVNSDVAAVVATVLGALGLDASRVMWSSPSPILPRPRSEL